MPESITFVTDLGDEVSTRAPSSAELAGIAMSSIESLVHRLHRAERSLGAFGFTECGGELWKPKAGDAGFTRGLLDEVSDLRRQVATLQDIELDSSEWCDAVMQSCKRAGYDGVEPVNQFISGLSVALVEADERVERMAVSAAKTAADLGLACLAVGNQNMKRGGALVEIEAFARKWSSGPERPDALWEVAEKAKAGIQTSTVAPAPVCRCGPEGCADSTCHGRNGGV